MNSNFVVSPLINVPLLYTWFSFLFVPTEYQCESCYPREFYTKIQVNLFQLRNCQLIVLINFLQISSYLISIWTKYSSNSIANQITESIFQPKVYFLLEVFKSNAIAILKSSQYIFSSLEANHQPIK